MAVTEGRPLGPPDVEDVCRDTRAALDAVLTAARSLGGTPHADGVLGDDAPRIARRPGGLAGPSALPGWSRGHVLAHLTAVGEAMARQAEHAARGEVVEVYDGGAAGREAGIQAGARRTAAEHVAALEALADRLDRAWPAPGSRGWGARVAYRDGTVADALVAWWREVRIHAVDLDVAIGPDTWPRPLCLHLLDFLGVRLAEEVVVQLTPLLPSDDARDMGQEPPLVVGPSGLRRVTDASDRGDGAGTVVVRGHLRDVAAWLAGRAPVVEPAAHRAGEPAPLPQIGPWPSPYSPPSERPARPERAPVAQREPGLPR